MTHQIHGLTDIVVGEDGTLCGVCCYSLASIHVTETVEIVDNATEQRWVDKSLHHYCTGCALQKLKSDIGLSIDDDTPIDGST